MYDHPYISDPNYSTTVVSWFDGGLHFFERTPEGAFGLNVFHIAYGTIFLVALIMCHVWWKRGSFRVRKRLVLDSILVAVAAIMIGGRLGEAIFYQPHYYFSHPMRLITNASGFTIHGMILFTIIVFWFWARWIKRPWFHMLDQSVIFVAFGTILGRIANFLSADLWGRQTDVPWAVRFPLRGPLFRRVVANTQGKIYMVVNDHLPNGKDAVHLEPWKPDQGYEIAKNAPLYDYPVGSPNSHVHELARMVITTPRHPSQLYQAFTEGVVLLVILIITRYRAKNVGTLSAVFLVAYGLLRTVAEIFRQPEPGLGFIDGLTRGQLLSLSMVIGGLILFAFIKKKPIRIDSIPTDAPGFTPQIDAPQEPEKKPEEQPAA